MIHKLNKNSYVPLTKQIVDILVNRIIVGRYKVGESIPSQTVLMKEFEVSLITIRHAFKELSENGIISTQKGKATIIKKIPPNSYDKYHTLRGFTADKVQLEKHTVVKSITIEKGSKKNRSALLLHAKESIVTIKRQRFINTFPVALEVSYLNAALFKNISWKKQLKNDVSLYQLIKEKANIEVLYAEEKIDAIMSSKKDEFFFNLSESTALLFINRVSYYHMHKRPFECSEYCIIPKYYGIIKFTR